MKRLGRLAGGTVLVAGITALATAMAPVAAQTSAQGAAPSPVTWPVKPITVIVPFAAGGPTDVVARLVGEHMSRTLGQQLVIENIGGAGGSTGMARVAAAMPDGYTIGVGNTGTQAAAAALYPALKYDSLTSFEQISVLNFTPQAIVAKKTTAANDLKEFIAYLKANHSKLSYGHAGVGSISHVAGLVFNTKYDLKPALVAYRGTGPALTDLISGQLDYIVDQSLNVIPQVKGGTIKIYAVAAKQRLASLPDVPTTLEAGDDFLFSAWNAMVAPKGTPSAITDRLLQAVGLALDDQALRMRFVDLGSTVPEGADRGPAGLARLVESEMAVIVPVLKASGVKGE